MALLSNHRGLIQQLMVENEHISKQNHDYETITSRTGSSSEDTSLERLRGPIDDHKLILCLFWHKLFSGKCFRHFFMFGGGKNNGQQKSFLV